jgi:hypothetical protein
VICHYLQAEKILFLTAKEAQAAETPAYQQPVPQSELAAAPPSSAAQVMMLLGLANVKDSKDFFPLALKMAAIHGCAS